jgi:hypothetical protein
VGDTNVSIQCGGQESRDVKQCSLAMLIVGTIATTKGRGTSLGGKPSDRLRMELSVFFSSN